jgi:tRNA (adenine57-N1/adenine58-N1)-methyltransferase
MDFARPHIRNDSTASISNIRLVKVKKESNGNVTTNAAVQLKTEPSGAEDSTSSLDEMLLQASNAAARDLLLAGHAKDKDELVDASLYTERSTPRNDSIEMGDLVVIMESFDRLTFVYIVEGGIYSNRNGHFHHQDFIGMPYGSKIRSRNNRGYGFCYLLKPTPELWARSLNHRTQIVHELDQSQIIFQLHLRPNMTVVESGTGSGAMSHAILRTIAPQGRLHTYEFNQNRAETAEKEFASNGVGHLVTVHHRDVCSSKEQDGGFDLPESTVDAIFLDLPEPWLAVPHAAFILKPSARIATYSPCVEQTQKTIEFMQAAGFHSIKTMEYRLQEHYVDEVEYERPPRAKRPKFEPHDNESRTNGGDVDANCGKTTVSSAEKDAESECDTKTQEKTIPSKEDEEKKKLVVARPFVTMRGHTAFLTFATAGNKPQPNPKLS